MTRPILVAVALDHDLEDTVRMAAEMGRRLGAPVVPVHVLGRVPFSDEGAIREQLRPHLAPLNNEDDEPADLVVLKGKASNVLVEEAARRRAQLIVVGGGGTGTIRRWLFGSTAEAVVRGALCPVYIVRGVYPIGAPILVPVDGSPQSRIGFQLGLRMARAFDTSLVPLRVVPEPPGGVSVEELVRRTDTEEITALAELKKFVDAVDTEGVEITPKAMIGPPAERVVEAADDAGLLVIGSRGFDLLRPTALGHVTEKVVRFTRVGVITVRDPDPDHEAREAQLQRVADLKQQGRDALAAGDAESAVALLELAASLAPANAAVQLWLAEALDGVGRAAEAESRREFAQKIRERFV